VYQYSHDAAGKPIIREGEARLRTCVGHEANMWKAARHVEGCTSCVISEANMR
jgi:hypothetical protein